MIGEIIKTSLGGICGFEKDGCFVYLGIPFGKPPVGEYAFKHPLPPEPWEGVLNATHGSSNPIQAKGGFYIGNHSLDCLYLNVFVPQNADTPLPVMVWIYGGAYSQGGAGAEEKGTRKLQYDMARFAKETGCIVVTFNYRLNLYGFLNLHTLDSSFDQNNGLYDQIMALRFVQEHIAFFGGDPKNVTVFGQSAGGACILALMTMREADGMFHKAIVQSACIEHFFTAEESGKFTRAYLRYAGVRAPNELLSLDEKRICDALTEHIYVRPQSEMLEGYDGPVWRYSYQHPFPGSGMGCFHGSELPVLLGLNLFFGKADDAVSENVGHEMRQIWSAFARTGTASWPQYNREAFIQRIG